MDAQIDFILSLISSDEIFKNIVPLVTNDVLLHRHTIKDKKHFINILIANKHYKFIQYLFDTLSFFRSIFYEQFQSYLFSTDCKPIHFNQIISKSMVDYCNQDGLNLLLISVHNMYLNNHYKLAKFLLSSDLCNLHQVHNESNILHIICQKNYATDENKNRQKKLFYLALLKNISINQLNHIQMTPVSIALHNNAFYLINYILENYKYITVADLMINLNDDTKIKLKALLNEKCSNNIQLYDYVSYQHGEYLLTGTVMSETKLNYVTIVFDLVQTHAKLLDWTSDQLCITVKKSKLNKISLAEDEIIPGSIITSIDKIQLGMIITNGLVINKCQSFIIIGICKDKNEITIKQLNNPLVVLHNNLLVECGNAKYRYAF